MSVPTVTVELVDEIAAFLERRGPTSCDGIARDIQRLRTRVLHVLESDARFIRSGRSRRTRWALADSVARNGNETDNFATNGAGGTSESSSTSEAAERRWSWGPPERSVCTDLAGHRGNNAHYRSGPWAGLCIICDGLPLAPPVTFREWMRREGGEARLQQFENDYQDHVAGRATPEQRERMAYAFGDSPEDD